MIRRIVFAGQESHSFARAAVVLEQVGGARASAKTIERVTMQIGRELETIRDRGNGLGTTPADAPNLAVIEIDGGRIMTRSMDQGPGVHDPAWRENKNATFVRMQTKSHEQDPHPELPTAFCEHQHVAEIAGFPVSEGPPEAESEPVSATSEPSSYATSIRTPRTSSARYQ